MPIKRETREIYVTSHGSYFESRGDAIAADVLERLTDVFKRGGMDIEIARAAAKIASDHRYQMTLILTDKYEDAGDGAWSKAFKTDRST